MTSISTTPPEAATRATTIAIFLRFLRIGVVAWGGPVAQIAMLRRDLVERERWVEPDRFNRAMAVYQALPGPEAHELCVYLGHVRHGRRGGIAAGLGFMLPGFLMMLAFSWAYLRFGIEDAWAAGLFSGFAPAVAAIVLRALRRIGGSVIRDRWLLAIGSAAALLELAGVHFGISFVLGGIAYALVRRGAPALGAAVICAILAIGATVALTGDANSPATRDDGPSIDQLEHPGAGEVAVAGLRGGLLTFGGAYTAIPFIEQDAVRDGHWLTREQFLDGLAIGTSLPAPLIIFGTFVGYAGGGLWAAMLMTAMIFLPAFAFTLLGHRQLERLVDDTRMHALLDGITAAVVGLMAVVTVDLTLSALDGGVEVAILAGALVALHQWRSSLALVSVMLASGLVGMAAALLA